MYKKIKILLLMSIVSCVGCNTNTANKQVDITKLTWQQIVDNAKGKTVVMNMYGGFKKGNSYMTNYAVLQLLKQYNITLKIVPAQGNEIVNNIMAQKESSTQNGQIDLCWINGETFYQLRQINGLYGPFIKQLPNVKYINLNDPIIKYDFQEEVKGFEAPWGKANYIVITDTARVKKIPISMQDFEAYWQQYPGKFTLAQDFMGLTLLKSWLVELAGGMQVLDGPFDEKKYHIYSTQLWQFINKNKKYFWKNGETFPASNVAVSQMFGSGELDFAFAFGNTDIDTKVSEGLYPNTSKGYILKAGSIHNTSYLGIPYNSVNVEAAMVVCNFLISPEAQIKKVDINAWGSTMILDYDKLDAQWQTAYKALPKLKYGINEAEVNAKSIKETGPKYMIKVAEDFRKFVINTK